MSLTALNSSAQTPSVATPLIVLASASPRRRQLLEQIGVRHVVHAVDVDEQVQHGEAAVDYVVRLARTKSEVGWRALPAAERLPVLGADTAVILGDEILGKPRDRADGLRMLARLSGTTHQVYTAVALRDAAGLATRLSVSDVSFRELSEAERAAYWDTGEPHDKAGAYAVQGQGAAFIIRISGSYSGIMGLPLAETADLLGPAGWRLGPATGAIP